MEDHARGAGWTNRVVLSGATAVLLAAACGGSPSKPSQPPPPTQQGPVVTAIVPNTGSTVGGTAVTITGANFRAGATVSIGGAAATNVTVQSATSISATTPQHTAGSVDVVVTVGALSGTLPGGFTFSVPQASNAPPTITGMSAQDRRHGTPKGFADLEDLVEEIAMGSVGALGKP